MLSERWPHKAGIETSFTDPVELEAIYAQACANPTHCVADLARLAAVAGSLGAEFDVNHGMGTYLFV